MQTDDAFIDDDAVPPGHYVVPDGGVVKVRLDMLDSVQREVFDAANHQPHYARVSDEVSKARAAARNEYIARVTDSWKMRRHDAFPGDHAGVPSDASERLRRHQHGEQLDAAESQRQRDAAWRRYCDNLQNAYKMNPRAAPEIERQAESAKWRHGR